MPRGKKLYAAALGENPRGVFGLACPAVKIVCNGPSVTLGCRGVEGEAHSRHRVSALRHMVPPEVSTITERHGRCGVHGSGIFLHSPSNHSRDRYHPVTSAPACLRASATTSCDREQLLFVAPHAWLVASLHRDARAFTCHMCYCTPLQARGRPVNHVLFVSLRSHPTLPLPWLSSAPSSVPFSSSSGKLLCPLQTLFLGVAGPPCTFSVPPSDRGVDADL